ncbi:hypothetical protein BGZ63DRAFT_495364 [Mariannaea sp. PMI_226]|nr:hypothetical protein BGZ63DRAFT_495364 [Mariannaea sp. PMI_226]
MQELRNVQKTAGKARNISPPKGKTSLRTSPTKAKRVRTGCLTCRERHLKCDEAVPDCMNCRKRGRECKRGLRLNFLDINVHNPTCVAPVEEWAVQFFDESREIASEYVGGLSRYAQYDLGSIGTVKGKPNDHRKTDRTSDTELKGRLVEGLSFDDRSPIQQHSNGSSPFSTRTPASTVAFADIKFPTDLSHQQENRPVVQLSSADYFDFSERDRLSTPEEIRYMRVFIQEVGIWLDSFNQERQFSHLIPYYALQSTMILNAFLACGAKHLSLASAEENDKKALFYHNTATSQLLRNLQNPDRNMAECATTAVILNVYEFMSEKPAHRMRHIAGARALILECKWNARSSGTGAACFWQNITMEILVCLSTRWKTTWDPEDWGLDMDFVREGSEKVECVSDEVFVHRILFIMAKIVNFRATTTQDLVTTTTSLGEDGLVSEKLHQWQELQRLCDRWNDRCPRTMHSYGYMRPTSSSDESNFPCIWLIRKTAILGRLFYHTAQSLLAQHHPVEEVRRSEGINLLRLHHAHQICGIVAHTKDGGVAPVAIRCLAIAASVLHEPREHAEVLEMLSRIKSQTGWHTYAIESELKRTWEWERGRAPLSGHNVVPFSLQLPVSGHTMPPPLRPLTTRILSLNPLSFADFSLPNHPYQNWYEPPSRSSVELKKA